MLDNLLMITLLADYLTVLTYNYCFDVIALGKDLNKFQTVCVLQDCILLRWCMSNEISCCMANDSTLKPNAPHADILFHEPMATLPLSYPDSSWKG